MGQTIDLADITLCLVELGGDLGVRVAGSAKLQDSSLARGQAVIACGSAIARDGSPSKKTLDEIRAPVEAGGDFLDAHSFVA